MHSALFLAAAASLVSASTPPGFEPAVSNTLVVQFGNTLVNGQVVEKYLTTTQPQIGTTKRLNGTSFAVIMVDLDIPTTTAGQTSTLLHWMQTGLTQLAQSTVAANGTAGTSASAAESVFFLRNATQAPAAAYISPNPPARIPLSHTYAQFLVDTTGLSNQSTAMTTLFSAAAAGRQNFSVQQVLLRAGLSDKVVAANFFNVTNPGPVQDATTTTNTTATSSESTTSSAAASTKSSTNAAKNSSTSASSSASATATAVVVSDATPYSVVAGTTVVLLAGLSGLFLSL